jgi:hypothetical protein
MLGIDRLCLCPHKQIVGDLILEVCEDTNFGVKSPVFRLSIINIFITELTSK